MARSRPDTMLIREGDHREASSPSGTARSLPFIVVRGWPDLRAHGNRDHLRTGVRDGADVGIRADHVLVAIPSELQEVQLLTVPGGRNPPTDDCAEPDRRREPEGIRDPNGASASRLSPPRLL